MPRPEIVCWNGEGEVPEAIVAALDRGEFDCESCTPQMHVHRLEAIVITADDGGMAVHQGYDLLVGHPEGCKVAAAEQRRAAGAAGLN